MKKSKELPAVARVKYSAFNMERVWEKYVDAILMIWWYVVSEKSWRKGLIIEIYDCPESVASEILLQKHEFEKCESAFNRK